MSTVRQHTRDRSRAPSFDEHQEINTNAHAQYAGSKRLFSNRFSRQVDDYEDDNDENEGRNQERHSEKRPRNADWPLQNTSPASTTSNRQPLQHRNGQNSPSNRRSRASSQRPSRFIEGSMNDRVSKKPPTTYLEGEEFDAGVENEGRRGRKMARNSKFGHRRGGSVTASTERSDNRNSIFRFGKSIAASFNPSNWKIWSKGQQVEEDEETAHLRLLRERKEKAERIYMELKESGRFRESPFGVTEYESLSPTRVHVKHDSGIDFNEHELGGRRSRDTSREEKRMGRVFLEPPKLSNTQRDDSPVSNVSTSVSQSNVSATSSPSKTGFHFKKHSLSNLKKSFGSVSNLDLSNNGEPHHQARRVPSRKDLHKQQKLVKRVSDLEGKLEAARRQLNESYRESMPPLPIPTQPVQPSERIGRSRFVPGALPSLLSERLLSDYVNSEEDGSETDVASDIGKAITSSAKKSKYQPRIEAEMNAGRRGSSVGAPWLDKPLPPPGFSSPPDEDQVLPSIETQSIVESISNRDDEVEKNTVVSETSATSSQWADPDDTDYRESDNESTPKPARKAAAKVTKSTPQKLQSQPPSRKRKSSVYRPSESESEVSDGTSLVRPTTRAPKSTITLTRANRPPRKLVKISQSEESSAKNSPATPNTRPSSSQSSARASSVTPKASNNSGSLKAVKQTVTSPPPSGRLMKSAIPPLAPGRQQSMSPPPSSATFAGVEPAGSPPVPVFAPAKYPEPAYTADPTTDDIPPMPKMPESIKLLTGEVIRTTASTFVHTSSAEAKLKKDKAAELREKRENKARAEEQMPQPKKSFEWPEDVF